MGGVDIARRSRLGGSAAVLGLLLLLYAYLASRAPPLVPPPPGSIPLATVFGAGALLVILALVVAASGAESPPRQRTWFERMMHPATSHPGESMGVDEIRLLRVLSDGKKRTYVHLTKEFGIPMTHHAPLWASELARRPLQLGFIRRRFGGYYEITPEGMAYLRGSR